MIPEISNALAARDHKQPRAEDGVGIIPISFGAQMSVPQVDFGVNQTLQAKNPMAVAHVAPTLRAGGNQTGGDRPPGTDVDTVESLIPQPIGVFFGGQGAKAGGIAYDEKVAPTLKAGDGGNRTPSAHIGMAVRRLTPRECERLQGFPDDFTLVPHRGKPAADGPRYKALGNSMAVNVMQFLGERIQLVEDRLAELRQGEAA